ncbi:MAG: DNA gyrase subunit A [Limnochordia bacterium]
MAVEFPIGRVVPVVLEEEMRQSYLDYAMNVIVDRALPDVRDGLKPVQRRILYSLYELGMRPDRPYKKSARLVGEVMGKYHPHGDSAIYDAMVRMGQDFSYRYMLVDGHGNYGSIDGDPPAAMRYTECRMSKLALEMLRDIDKDTVDFYPNFDETLEQPTVLPSRFPNLLVNGAMGIAVGMSTNIPPHNLGEVIDALIMLIEQPEATVEQLMTKIKGPDFPTGGVVVGYDGIREAYTTGRGRIQVRGRVNIETERNGRQRIVITEIPYTVNKAVLIERIAALHNDRKIEGISALRDESDRKGIRVVIELRRDVNPHVTINQLYKHTPLQITFGIISLALVDNEPRVMNLRRLLVEYLAHQKDVVTRRTRFELHKAEERAHLLEGYRIALDHIDEIIAIIRAADNDQQAKTQLMERFGFTERQAVAILDMQLRRLTGLEREKIEQEYNELQKTIARLRAILADESQLMDVIRKELLEVRRNFVDERRTEIVAQSDDIDIEDLIAEEDVVITLTHAGYIKRQPLSSWRNQKRGGRGLTALNTREDDFVEHLFVASTHTNVLFFTNRGLVHRLRGHEIPESSRNARGSAIVNLIELDKNERVQATVMVDSYDDSRYLFMATRQGLVKKTVLSEYDSTFKGLIAINLAEDDELVDVALTDGNCEVILVTTKGQAIRFSEDDVRPMGRATRGVKGITLEKDDHVVGFDVVEPNKDLLVATTTGYGKRTALSEYRMIRRGGKGVRTLQMTHRNGDIAGVTVVDEADEIMFITMEGIMIRMSVSDISSMGRTTQGVRLMKLEENDSLVALAHVVRQEDGD